MISELTDWPVDPRKTAEAWAKHFAGQEPGPPADVLLEVASVTEAQKAHERDLLRRENVVGVAAGVKVKKGAPTGEPAVTVLVESKVPKSRLSESALVPAKLDGVPTDVIESGPIRPLAFNARGAAGASRATASATTTSRPGRSAASCATSAAAAASSSTTATVGRARSATATT